VSFAKSRYFCSIPTLASNQNPLFIGVLWGLGVRVSPESSPVRLPVQNSVTARSTLAHCSLMRHVPTVSHSQPCPWPSSKWVHSGNGFGPQRIPAEAARVKKPRRAAVLELRAGQRLPIPNAGRCQWGIRARGPRAMRENFTRLGFLIPEEFNFRAVLQKISLGIVSAREISIKCVESGYGSDKAC